MRALPEYLLTTETPATKWAVTLDEAKQHCRVDSDDTEDDAVLTRLIKAATDMVEQQAGKALLEQTWNLLIAAPDGAGHLHLPLTPVISVDDISYFDRDNVSQSATVGDFQLYKDEDHAWLEPKQGNVWPATYARHDAITVQFKAGFGANETDVPENLRQAVLLTVGHWFENREAIVVGTIAAEMPLTAQHLIDLSRKGWFGG